MMKVKLRLLPLAAVCLLTLPTLALAADMEVVPFKTLNHHPLLMIHPLPADSSAVVTPKGKLTTTLTYDLTNNYTSAAANDEVLLLDGESTRTTLFLRYGLTDRVEIGAEIPWITQGEGLGVGFLDSTIIHWHDLVGSPQRGRDTAPRNRTLYSYTKAGQQKLLVDSTSSGIGDVVLSTALKLYDDVQPASHKSTALRATLKLPSGDSGNLHGSGAVGGSVSLSGAANYFTKYGTLGIFGSLGGLYSAKGDVLSEEQKPFAAFGTFGFGWGTSPSVSYKAQLNVNTSPYKEKVRATLAEIAHPALTTVDAVIVFGAALKLVGEYTLDIGIAENFGVGSVPDVSLHLALGKTF